MKKNLILIMITVILFISSCATTGKADPNGFVGMEIINLPREFIGSTSQVRLFLVGVNQNQDLPRFQDTIGSQEFSGYFEYEDGTKFLRRNVQKSERYMALFMILNDAGRVTIHKTSRPVYLQPDITKLDYEKDFFESATEAMRGRL